MARVPPPPTFRDPPTSTISALSFTSAAWATTQTQRPSAPPPGGGPEKTYDAIGDDLLGLDVDSLTAHLDSGMAMTELAEAAGISNDDITATIQATDALSGMATDIASGRTCSTPTHRSRPADQRPEQGAVVNGCA